MALLLAKDSVGRVFRQREHFLLAGISDIKSYSPPF